MSAFNISLTDVERTLLTRMLESALGETRVEIHRTHFSPAVRDELLKEEQTIRGLLERVRSAKA